MTIAKPPITYIPNFIKDPGSMMNSLTSLDWERRPDAPRCEYYCNDFKAEYSYGRGKGVRTYSPKDWHPSIREVRTALESQTGSIFEVCFLNRYLNQSDQLGWHADDSPEMDDDRPIGIVSFGVEREIWFRPNPKITSSTPGVIEKVKLESGSLCIMAPGMQDSWEHRIPKASFVCGERISMTFRGYVSVPKVLKIKT